MEATFTTPVVRCFSEGKRSVVSDAVAVEEPLEIRVVNDGEPRTLSVTMRTPGADADLAVGFLFTEGAIARAADVVSVESREHSVDVHLRKGLHPDWGRFERHVYLSSSCGVCGKASIEAVSQTCTLRPHEFSIVPSVLRSLPERLRGAQAAFQSTGGIHAAGWFSPEGELLAHAEDVGRHNALDKLIGHLLQQGEVPLPPGILALSGRASFELIQKARLAGASVVAAVGAPSSLAVELSAEGDLTLAGFVRHDRFNLYTGAHRVQPEIPVS